MKGTILYLSYDGLTDPLGQSQILPYLNGLANKGYVIHIISFEKFLLTKSSLHLHTNIIWHPLPYHKSPPVLGTLWDIYKLNKLALNISQEHKIKIAHCRSYITSLIGLKLKNRFSLKFIFDMRGFWADERVEGGIWNLNNPIFKTIYKYFKNKEKVFIKNADAIISLTHNAKFEIINNDNLSGKDTKIKDVITVIPTCVDTVLFKPDIPSKIKQDQLKSKLGINSNDYVLLYLGSIGTWYLLDDMLRFFIALKNQQTNSKFLFITNETSSRIQKTYRTICELGSHKYNPKDIIVKKSSRENVPLYASLCDASIFFIKPSYSKKASAATKMAEVLAMGKPIITNTDWGDVELFVKPEIGILNSSFDDSSYQLAVKDLLSTNWVENQIRKYAIDNFSLSQGIDSYDLIYKSLAKE